MLLQISEEEKLTSDPLFWNNPSKAEEILKNIQEKRQWTNALQYCQDLLEETEVLIELGATEMELSQHQNALENALSELEFKTMFTGEEDHLKAMVQISSGAGGTESCDWVAMLMRMYMRWAEKSGHKISVVDLQDGGQAGVKQVTIEVGGNLAFGMLRGENGVHRMERISPFDSNSKRQTSFASVYVYPLVDETITIEIKPCDVEMDTFRCSGSGGQNVNKLETGVRLRHLPSGIVVECTETRTQHQNKERAYQLLRSKLYKVEMDKKNSIRQDIESKKMTTAFGSQIRTYKLQPHRLIKDARTGFESMETEKVLDGGLDGFLRAYLMEEKNEVHA